MPTPSGPSSLVLQEYLSTQDARFVSAMRDASDPKILSTIADRWRRDTRAWAKAQVIEYLSLPFDRPGHQPVIKRLFKQAEEKRDRELMGAFMAAFDRMIRRQRTTRYHYDWKTRQSWESEHLVAPPVRRPFVLRFGPHAGEMVSPPGVGVFSNRTRTYLRRRAWRFFRRLGFQHPEQYVAAVATALRRYRDEDLPNGESILDSWGLMHACFFESEIVRFNAHHAALKDEASMASLSAAPAFAELWRDYSAMPALLDLVSAAQSRLVRIWSMQLLRREHAERLGDLDPQQIIPLLDHDDEEVQQFGAELLDRVRGLERLTIDTWLTLLKTRNLVALETLCRLMRKHVVPDRLTLAQLIELACSKATPTAWLGLDLLRARPVIRNSERQMLAELANARCAGTGRELAAWVLGNLTAGGTYDTDLVAPFFDSLTKEVRQGAWEWLTPVSPGYNDSALFSRLLETPYEDLRLRLVEMLQSRSSLPGARPDDLAVIWCAVLLGIHRGGRHKLKALSQISQSIKRDPDRAAALIPVIAIAIRSVRSAEARPALAALVGAVEAAPQLAPLVGRFLPELELSPQEAAR